MNPDGVAVADDRKSRERPTFALVGNPNSGKTTLFNALTGLRQKVGNYPGVTVERKEGALTLPDNSPARLVDLPGLYSLTPHSPDEKIARDVLLGLLSHSPRPDLLVNVVDASNLERNLYLTSQLLELGIPMVIALTMNDLASRRAILVDAEALASELGVPVLMVNSSRRGTLAPLLDALLPADIAPNTPEPRKLGFPGPLKTAMETLHREIAREMARGGESSDPRADSVAFAEAVALLGLPEGPLQEQQAVRFGHDVRESLIAATKSLQELRIDAPTAIAEARYADIGRIVHRAVRHGAAPPVSVSEKLDRVFLHKFWGYVVFLFLMVVLFQAMFSWASAPMDLISGLVDGLGRKLTAAMPPGDLRDLFIAGVLGGVGNSLVFLPQILLLFLFISLLEDTGYLARAAFLMDRLMSRVGLHGKSFIPLLSSYACAIPGIMATRTIESNRARLLTILVAPLMSCSARLPVYSVLIGAFIPNTLVAGVQIFGHAIGLRLPGLTLFCMYALGTVLAFAMAALFHRTLLKGEAPSFVMEMPPYRMPSVRTVIGQMLERSWLFLRRAGTVILSISVVLWFLATYPKSPVETPKSEQLARSYAGQFGKFLEPAIAPLGFDWKMGIGLVSSFAAREVFVTAMGTIYNIDDDTAADEEKLSVAVKERMRAEVDPRTGKPVYTPLVAVCLMVYYVLAMQCMSTIAVVKRETGGWKWPLFQLAYMTALAWFVTFAVRLTGKALGYE